MTEIIHKQFADMVIYSESARTAVSVRDGVLEYLGAELNMEPIDKIFTVYRSPATIANSAHAMTGIPLTDEHVSMDAPALDSGSRVESSTLIDQIDESTFSRLAVQNKLAVSDALQFLLKDKRQLSLGYEADLVPHSRWDFEQINIIPHHLAVVPAGRCGPLCSFLDRKMEKTRRDRTVKKLIRAFTDEDGSVNLEQIVEIATALPDAIKKVPVDQLIKLMPAMQEIMAFAKAQGALPAEVPEPNAEDEAAEKDGEKMKDEDGEEKKEAFADSARFKDAVASAVRGQMKIYAEVLNKARNFVDADYNFAGKTANQVMTDALATQSPDKFEDSELPVAFKLLRRPDTDYSQFGDSKTVTGLESRITAALEER